MINRAPVLTLWGAVVAEIMELARSLTPSDLAKKTYTIYEKFRPDIPPGKRG